MSDFNLGPDDFADWSHWLAYVDLVVDLTLDPDEMKIRYQLVLMRVWIAEHSPEITF